MSFVKGCSGGSEALTWFSALGGRSNKLRPLFLEGRTAPESKMLCKGVTIVTTAYSVAEWLACWTQAQKGLGSYHNRDAVG